jgi:hypothetical protein
VTKVRERRCVPVLPELVGRLVLDQRYLVLACIRQHTSAYASIRQHTPAYASIRQHTSAYGGWYSTSASCTRLQQGACWRALRSHYRQHTSAYVSIRQHTSAYVSIRQHTSEHVSIRQHASSPAVAGSLLASTTEPLSAAHVSIRQHTSAYVSIRQHTSAHVSIRPRLQWQGVCWRARRSHYQDRGRRAHSCRTWCRTHMLSFCVSICTFVAEQHEI